MYTVPKLDDYSPAALDRAVADLFAALDAETGGADERIRLEGHFATAGWRARTAF